MPLYAAVEARQALLDPASMAARTGVTILRNPFNPWAYTAAGQMAAAALEVFARTTARYEKPEFGIRKTDINGTEHSVSVGAPVWERPFCKLLPFNVGGLTEEQIAARPNMLLVAPMSGHYATLLRGTVEAFLPDHNVYITDWQSARDVPLSAGRFDLDDYTDYVADMFRHFKGHVHAFAVCQPSVPVMAAIARMEAENDPHVPRSVIMAGGPIDTRINPTAVNKFPAEKGRTPDEIMGWFRRNVIHTVPWPNAGFGRRVYPGFLQLTGFITMNLDRHMKAHRDLFTNLVKGDGDSAERHRAFYDEYLAVMDLTAEFYDQTVERVFVRHQLPKGEYVYRPGTPKAQPINLKSIRRVPMMTIEGEKDDITGIGQCRAATGLTSLPASMIEHHEEPKVGHYGVFNGGRFIRNIAPRIKAFVNTHSPRVGHHLRLAADKGRRLDS